MSRSSPDRSTGTDSTRRAGVCAGHAGLVWMRQEVRDPAQCLARDAMGRETMRLHMQGTEERRLELAADTPDADGQVRATSTLPTTPNWSTGGIGRPAGQMDGPSTPPTGWVTPCPASRRWSWGGRGNRPVYGDLT